MEAEASIVERFERQARLAAVYAVDRFASDLPSVLAVGPVAHVAARDERAASPTALRAGLAARLADCSRAPARTAQP